MVHAGLLVWMTFKLNKLCYDGLRIIRAVIITHPSLKRTAHLSLQKIMETYYNDRSKTFQGYYICDPHLLVS